MIFPENRFPLFRIMLRMPRIVLALPEHGQERNAARDQRGVNSRAL